MDLTDAPITIEDIVVCRTPANANSDQVLLDTSNFNEHEKNDARDNIKEKKLKTSFILSISNTLNIFRIFKDTGRIKIVVFIQIS